MILLILFGIIGITFLPISWVWFWIVLLGMGGSGTFAIIMMLFALRTRHTAQAAALSGISQTVGYTIAILGSLA